MNPPSVKELEFDAKAREKLLAGAKKVEQAVATTLGPLGNNVVIDRPYGVPAVVHDGVFVAQQVIVEDRFENMGVELMKRAAQETNNVAGDGTTTSIILAYSILAEGHKHVVAGRNAMLLRKGILAASDALNEELTNLAQPVSSEDEKLHIATISAQDENIGKAIVQSLDMVGQDGVVTVEKSGGDDLVIEYKDGLQFNKGLIATEFMTNPATHEAEIKKPQLVIADYDIVEYGDLHQALELIVSETGRSDIVIIAKSFSLPVLQGLAKNKADDGISVLPIEAPGIGDGVQDYLTDIAIATNATVISQRTGKKLRELKITDLGEAEEILCGVEQTLIVGGKPKKFDFDKHVKYLKERSGRTDLKNFEAERLKERLAKLTGGIAIINVGGNEADIQERMERVIDALSATRAAIQEGIVQGGETVLLRARQVLDKLNLDGDQAVGVDVVRKAVEAPFKKLVLNAGQNPEELIAKVLETGKGVDLNTLELTDLVSKGIVDPVKVTRHALKNASTVATTILSVGTLIGLKVNEKSTRTPAQTA